MSNPRFSYGDCARAQRLLRAVIESKGQTVMGAYTEACRALELAHEESGTTIVGHPEGWYVDSRNQLRPIRAPRREKAPVARTLIPRGLNSTDDVEARPTRFDPQELDGNPSLDQTEGFDSEQAVGVLPDVLPLEPDFDADLEDESYDDDETN
jgi:hypothetical protein